MADEHKLKNGIESFISKHGVPTLIVAPRAFKFLLEEVVFGIPRIEGFRAFTLPSIVWPARVVYLENVMARGTFEL